MILGVGVDILKIKHFQLAIKKTPQLLERVFTSSELKKAQSLSPTRQKAYFAKRFAAKEATAKACGTGIGKHMGWKDISISNLESGAPYVKINSKVTTFLCKKFNIKTPKILISLSDEKDSVIAFALLQEKK